MLGLGAGAYFIAPGVTFNAPAALAQIFQEAKTVPAPIGFADIVEKVKPAVISVRVKIARPRRRPIASCRSPRARRWSSSSGASACLMGVPRGGGRGGREPRERAGLRLPDLG